MQSIRGQGKPVNDSLQRALRLSYLAATRDLLKARRDTAGLLDSDLIHWIDHALEWLKKVGEKMAEGSYFPPVPPGDVTPSLFPEPTAEQATAAVEGLNRMLATMLIGEWEQAGLSPVPDPIRRAIGEAHWFDQIAQHFANRLKTDPPVHAIFASGSSRGWTSKWTSF